MGVGGKEQQANRGGRGAIALSFLALVLSLGGIAVAGIPLADKQVKSNHIVDGHVRNADIADGSGSDFVLPAIRKSELAPNSVDGRVVAPGAIAENDFGLGSLVAQDFGSNSVKGVDVKEANLRLSKVFSDLKRDQSFLLVERSDPAGTAAVRPPPGRYLVFASGQVRTTVAEDIQLSCGINAGEVFQRYDVDLDDVMEPGFSASVALHDAITVSEGGEISFACALIDNVFGDADDEDAIIDEVSLTAVQVASLTRSTTSGPPTR